MGNKRMFIIPGGMIECDLANICLLYTSDAADEL